MTMRERESGEPKTGKEKRREKEGERTNERKRTDEEPGDGVRRVEEAGGRVDASELLELARVRGLGDGEVRRCRGGCCRGRGRGRR